ncbi:hypothetical protein GGH93_006044 [Coemansia aciculifera]|nr:hypothetical protein GGH93_006044 [Coemansia aciculifera]
MDRGETTVSKTRTRRNTRNERAETSRAESARTFEYTYESVRKMIMVDRLESGCIEAINAATKFAKAKEAERKEKEKKATKAKPSTATTRKIAQLTAPSSVLVKRANPTSGSTRSIVTK